MARLKATIEPLDNVKVFGQFCIVLKKKTSDTTQFFFIGKKSCVFAFSIRMYVFGMKILKIGKSQNGKIILYAFTLSKDSIAEKRSEIVKKGTGPFKPCP